MKIPTQWNEVPLRNYLEYVQVSQMEFDLPSDATVAMLAAISGTNDEEVERLTFSEFIAAVKKIKFLDKQPKGRLRKYIFLKGRIYKFSLSLEKCLPAQYIDLTYFIENEQDAINKQIACMMQVLTWRGWRYKEHQRTAIDALDIPMSIIAPLCAFFLNVWQACKIALPDYSLKMMQEKVAIAQKIAREQKRNSKINSLD